MSMITTCLKTVSLETTNCLIFAREPRCCLAGKYSYSIPEFNLGFHFVVLPVSVFCPFPEKFPFLVLPGANPIHDSNLIQCSQWLHLQCASTGTNIVTKDKSVIWTLESVPDLSCVCRHRFMILIYNSISLFTALLSNIVLPI